MTAIRTTHNEGPPGDEKCTPFVLRSQYVLFTATGKMRKKLPRRAQYSTASKYRLTYDSHAHIGHSSLDLAPRNRGHFSAGRPVLTLVSPRHRGRVRPESSATGPSLR